MPAESVLEIRCFAGRRGIRAPSDTLYSELLSISPYTGLAQTSDPLLADSAFSEQDEFDFWDELVSAPTLLGSDIVCERWVIAEYLLSLWIDWDSWVTRWAAYTGKEQDSLPARWASVRQKWKDRATDLLGDGDLLERIRASQSNAARLDMASESELVSSEAIEPASDLFGQIVERDSQTRLQRAFMSDLATRAVNQQTNADSEYRRAANSLPENERRHLARFLRNYRHTMSIVSWLDDGWLINFSRESWRTSTMAAEQVIDELVASLQEANLDRPRESNRALPEIASRVLRRIFAAVNELGYDDFVEDLQSSDFSPGPNTAVGGSRVNIIPGEDGSECHEIVVALSKGAGGRSRFSFESIMRRVKTHLIQCSGSTRMVVFLCDTWDAQRFQDEHFPDLSAHHRCHGVRFIFLQVGAPRTILAPIAVDLGRTAD